MDWKMIINWRKHFHIRKRNIRSLEDVIDLIDRFLEDNLRYGFEWDDFVTWYHEDKTIDSVRQKIEAMQLILLSSDPNDKFIYDAKLREIENELKSRINPLSAK